MLLYEYKVRDALEHARGLATHIKDKCENGAPADELERDVHVLKAACANLTRLLPEGVVAGSLDKRFAWADYWLGKNKPSNILGDLTDIVDRDLPAVEKGFRDWCASQKHYDAELGKGIGDLLTERQLDSAVRKAFVLLKERLVRNFGVSSELDGRDAVNKVFGREGFLAGRIPDAERESMRNLLDGLFGVFRNTYGHRDVAPEWHEADAVLSMVNLILQRLDAYRRPKSPKKGTV